MKRPNKESKLHSRKLSHQSFVIGDLYLFHSTKKYCPSRSSLWGIYDKTEGGIIYLESSTLDLRHFSLWHRLPEEYRFSRRATRRELRDYMYNMGHSDSLLRLPHTNKLPFIYPRPRHSFTHMLNGNT